MIGEMIMSKKNDTLKITVDGNEQELSVRRPNIQDIKEGQKIYNNTFYEAVKSNAFVRAKLNDFLKEQGLWDENKQLQYDGIRKELFDCEKKLDTGGIKLKDARAIAIHMIKLRNSMKDLIAVRTDLDNNTAEGQAENAKFNYLVSVCLVYNSTGNPYFASLEDYLDKGNTVEAGWGASKLGTMLYGLVSNYEEKLPEFKFLRRFNLVNDDLQFVDEKGRLVDEDSRLIDAQGRYINESGEFVDKDGNKIDSDGNYVVDFKPFLDDDGKPITEHKEPKEKKRRQEPEKVETKEEQKDTAKLEPQEIISTGQ